MSQGDNSEVMRRMEQDIKDLIARRDIYALVCGYMRALDRLLPDLHLSVFHDDAEVDCGLFVGPAPDFVRFAQKFLGKPDKIRRRLEDRQAKGNRRLGEK
jgi:hypothetical protein